MICVTFGTTPFQFNRVVGWLSTLLQEGSIAEPLLLQYGKNDVSLLAAHPLVTAVPLLEAHELLQWVDQSRLVISHAGQGSTRTLAARGAAFVIVPRLAELGEHMDDHQLWFAQSVEPFGVRHCLTLESLRTAILQPPPRFEGQLFNGPRLVDHLIQALPDLTSASPS